jgi:hypothetical protein
MKQLIFAPLILEEWKETRDTLQKYCRLVGAIRETLSRPLPRSLHTNLLICKNGFTTSLLPKNEQSPDQLFEVIIDLIHKRLRVESNYREPLYIALTGQSLNALCDETCSLLTDIGIKPPLERPSFLEGTRGQFDTGSVKAYWKAVSSTNRVLKKIKRELGKDAGPIQLGVDSLTLSLAWYCKKVFGNSLLEQIEFGFSTGDEKFSDAHFFISPFPNGQALKKIIPDEKRYQSTKDKSKMILPYSIVSKTENNEKALLNFYNRIIKYNLINT